MKQFMHILYMLRHVRHVKEPCQTYLPIRIHILCSMVCIIINITHSCADVPYAIWTIYMCSTRSMCSTRIQYTCVAHVSTNSIKCILYSRLQVGWHRILRLFLKLFKRTRILPMGFTISTNGEEDTNDKSRYAWY